MRHLQPRGARVGSPSRQSEGAAQSHVTLAESVQLVSALVTHIAKISAVDILVIKGPCADRALGMQRTWTDVDVLVRPDHSRRFLGALRKHGFVADVPDPALAPGHSVNCVPTHWGASVDVHLYYPGIRAPKALAFELLFKESISVSVGGYQCPTVSRIDHAILVALHSARSKIGSPKWLEADTAIGCLTSAELESMRQRMSILGATEVALLRWPVEGHIVPQSTHALWEAWRNKESSAALRAMMSNPESRGHALLTIVRLMALKVASAVRLLQHR